METVLLLAAILGFLAVVTVFFFGGFVILDFYFGSRGPSDEASKVPMSRLYFISVVVLSLSCLAWIAILLVNVAAFPSILSKLFDQLWRWDVLLFVTFISLHLAANLEPPRQSSPAKGREQKPPPDAKTILDMRNYAATALKDASTAYITAVSILIPASFVIVQLANSDTFDRAIPQASLDLVYRGVVYFLISLFSGMIVLFFVSTHGRDINLPRSLLAMIPFGFQFVALFVGISVIAAALYHVVF